MRRTNYSHEQMKNIVDALQIIPAHELVSYRAVSTLLTLRDAMRVLYNNVEQALEKCRTSKPPLDISDGTVSFTSSHIELF